MAHGAGVVGLMSARYPITEPGRAKARPYVDGNGDISSAHSGSSQMWRNSIG